MTTRNNGLNQTGAESDRLIQSRTDWYRVGQPGRATKRCQMLSAQLIRRVGLLMLSASHTLTVLSKEPDTILVPSGENATDVTVLVWP